MKTITVEKAKLLETLRENRAKHRDIFEEAVEGYRDQAVKLLEEHIVRIKAGKVQEVFVRLDTPVDETDSYDTIIGMLEMDLAETVELTQQEFSSYVQDNWSWRQQWLTSNSTYSATAASQL